MKFPIVMIALAGLTACASDKEAVSTLPVGSAAYAVVPAEVATATGDYRIGPLDTIDVSVFQEPDLSVKAIQVDASGRIALPLVGAIDAKGKTAPELSRELEQRFDAHYLRHSLVTVTIASSVSQKVSVQGEVTQPGIYPLTGPTTLLDVISMAKGETEVASLKQVTVFRTTGNQRMGAVFDIASIRRGAAADPVIEGNDLVVVGYSAGRRFWHNVVSAAPLFNVFRPLVP